MSLCNAITCPGSQMASFLPLINHKNLFKNNDTQRGFTLIELLVVMLLIGIVSAMVFVTVSSGFLKSSEKKFVQDFRQTITRARSASLARGIPIFFLIDGENRKYSIKGKKWKDIPESIQVEGSGIGQYRPGVFHVIFYPDGSSSGGEIDLKWSSGRIDRITIDRLLGIISVEVKG